MEEDCVRCGRLVVQGSDLCEGCMTKDSNYNKWKVDLQSTYQKEEE